MEKEKDSRPLTFKFALWYGFTMAVIFLLYGGVKLVLSFLDRNFTELNQLIFFLAYGAIIILFAVGLQSFKSWGRYGLVVINLILIIFGFIGISGLTTEMMVINLFMILLTAGIIYCLFAPATTKYLSRQG